MKVDTILEAKGRTVETVTPDTSVAVAIHKLATMGIGALVVSPDGEQLAGVLSEREVVRGLVRHRERLLDLRVGDVMAKGVPVCSPGDTVKDAMELMTRTRHRHLPVVDGQRLCGLLSIGDVVKNRLEEMELETTVLRDAYIVHR